MHYKAVVLRFCYGLTLMFGLLANSFFAAAQSPTNAAAYQKSIARVQGQLVKKDLRYVVKTTRTADPAKTEQSRLDLVARGEAAEATLRGLPDYPMNDLRARAQRLVRGLTAVYANDYKEVNDLIRYRGNSLEALRTYYEAQDAALQKTVVLNDSLMAARQDFADQFSLLLDSQDQREIAQWLGAQQRVAALFRYSHQVVLPVVRLRLAVSRLVETVGAADVTAFETARRRLAADAATSTAELAVLPDFINLDVSYRNAGREVAAKHAALCKNQLAQVSAQLKDHNPLTPDQAQAINRYLAEFSAQLTATNEAFEKAGADFFKMYTPVLDDANRH